MAEGDEVLSHKMLLYLVDIAIISKSLELLTRFSERCDTRQADLFGRVDDGICPGISACERAVWDGDVPEAGSSEAVNDCKNEVGYGSWRHKLIPFGLRWTDR